MLLKITVWHAEDTAWYSPALGSVGVYRLYNPDFGALGKMSHHYTTDLGKERILVAEHRWRWDNAPIESIWGRMKEQIGPTRHLCANKVVKLVNNYVHYYNNCRGQEHLGWKSPVEYERTLLAS